MDPKKLDIRIEAFSKGGPVIATDITPAYPYVNGARDTTKITGQRVTAVFPANGYESQVVKVSTPLDNLSPLLERATPDKPVRVTFEGFTASIYSMRGDDGRWRTGISAKATGVKPVLDDDDIVV